MRVEVRGLRRIVLLIPVLLFLSGCIDGYQPRTYDDVNVAVDKFVLAHLTEDADLLAEALGPNLTTTRPDGLGGVQSVTTTRQKYIHDIRASVWSVSTPVTVSITGRQFKQSGITATMSGLYLFEYIDDATNQSFQITEKITFELTRIWNFPDHYWVINTIAYR